MRCNQCGVDNPHGAAVCIGCGVQLGPNVVVSPGASAMAIAALVFGILGFPTCGLLGVIGIVLGIIALVQQTKPDANVGGKNLAIAGLVTGGLSLFVGPILILPAVLFPILSGNRDGAHNARCMSHMKQLGIAFNMYYTDCGMLPSSAIHTGSNQWDADGFVDFAMYKTAPNGRPTIYQVLSNYRKTGDIMWCPGDPEFKSGKRSRVSYYYKAAVDRSWFDGKRSEGDFAAPADQVIFWENCDQHHPKKQKGLVDGSLISVVFLDGHTAIECLTDSGYTAAETSPSPLPNSGKGEPAWFNTPIGTNTHSVGQYYDVSKYQDTFNGSLETDDYLD